MISILSRYGHGDDHARKNTETRERERESPLEREEEDPAVVSSPQLCDISASPYLWEIGVNGPFHTPLLLIKESERSLP
eukprot:scaffold3777_cov123-Isochrysis_galbana.AAC.8